MEYFRGDANPDFKVGEYFRSRYGFPALFFTSNLNLARAYAQYHTRKLEKKGSGFIFSFEAPDYIPEYDYKHSLSHSRHFRKLIYDFYHEGCEIIKLKNVVDYPSSEFADYTASDILVVFNLKLIKNLKEV